MATREEILKELELFPLWTLRSASTPVAAVADTVTASETAKVLDRTEAPALPKEKPSAKAALAQFRQASAASEQATLAQSSNVATKPTEATKAVPATKRNAPMYQLLASEDGRCLWVHDGEALDQDAMQLRHNMTKAMQLNIKPIQGVKPATEVLSNHAPTVVVLFGEKTAQTLLEVNDSIHDLRGMALMLGDYACVVSYDFQHLLANPQDKRKAWDDLCLALDILKESE